MKIVGISGSFGISDEVLRKQENWDNEMHLIMKFAGILLVVNSLWLWSTEEVEKKCSIRPCKELLSAESLELIGHREDFSMSELDCLFGTNQLFHQCVYRHQHSELKSISKLTEKGATIGSDKGESFSNECMRSSQSFDVYIRCFWWLRADI